MTPGINVDSTETDRTYYNSRGFDITSMHVDGIGIPFGSLIVGDLDTAIYEYSYALLGGFASYAFNNALRVSLIHRQRNGREVSQLREV